MIAKALIFAVFCVQAIRFDDKAELASLSALISKLKPKTKNTVGLGNTTGTVLSEVDESAGADTKSTIFDFTISHTQSYTVPSGVTKVNVYLWGAGGGGGGSNSRGGGAGALVLGSLTVVPGSQLGVIVGQGGHVYGTASVYGGGGLGTVYGGGTAGGGGGRSAIQLNGEDIVTAGGGGGATYYPSNGGAATFDGKANDASGASASGKGATESAGGAAGTGGTYGGIMMTAGTKYQGGRGSGYGAGGGGGYYGGGGGANDVSAGGGGGSSYTAGLSKIPGLLVLGYNSIDGVSRIDETDFATAGVGNGGAAGQAGGNGRVVIEISTGNGGTIKDLLNEIKNSIIDNKKDAIKQEADHCTDSVDGSVGETELDFGDSTKYFDLVGCDETSTCETGTDKEQTIATDAHKRIQELEAFLADLENKLKIKQAASATKTGDIEALEKKKTDNDALHQIRMKKFGDAITILNKIDSGLDESGKITMPEFLQLSKEEKKAIQNFRVGAAMLLVLDQATSGVGEKDLVQQLKTLLASCISSLEASKANEVKKHDDWIGFIEAELGGAQKEGEDIVTEIANLQGQILANKQETAAEEKKKADAIKISNSLRQTCLDAHSTYISDLAAYDSEIAAIEEMIKILIEAKLDDQTTAIRDETDLTKHGVQESLATGFCTSVGSKSQGNQTHCDTSQDNPPDYCRDGPQECCERFGCIWDSDDNEDGTDGGF